MTACIAHALASNVWVRRDEDRGLILVWSRAASCYGNGPRALFTLAQRSASPRLARDSVSSWSSIFRGSEVTVSTLCRGLRVILEKGRIDLVLARAWVLPPVMVWYTSQSSTRPGSSSYRFFRDSDLTIVFGGVL